jgi:hypothetical protein
MKLEVKNNCPLNNFEPCKQLECAWFVQMRGTDPNTGKEVDDYACAIAWTPMLLVENAAQSRQTGAAVESFRNEMVKGAQESQKLLIASMELNNGTPENIIKLVNE